MAHTRASQPSMIREAFREMMKGVATSSPGHILAFDPVTQLAQVQIGVTRVDVNGATFDPPAIIETPVYFPGGDYHIEYQIDPGCEGDILFSQRCIDGWIQTGGVASNPIGRFHDPQDAFFLPGFRSMPNIIPNFQNNGVRLSNRAGTQFMWLKNDNTMAMENGSGHIRMAADGTVTINGVTINPASLVTTPNDVVAQTVSLHNHRHTGSPTAPTGPISNTGVPVP